MIYTEYNDSSCNSNPILFTSYEVGHCFIDSNSSSTDDAYYSDSAPTSGMLSTSTNAAENLASSLLSRAMSKMTSSIKAEDASATAPPPYQFECYNPNSNGNSYYYYYDDYASSSSRKLSAGTRTSLLSAPTSTPNTTVSSYVFYCDQQEPRIIPTEDETCSSYTYAVLLEATCLAPTASPTIPPTSNDAVQLGVSQTINGCSYTDDYLVAPGLYDKTFRQAIIVSLQPSIPSIDSSSIVDFLGSPSSITVVATSIRSRQLQTPSVVISYTLQSASVSYLT